MNLKFPSDTLLNSHKHQESTLKVSINFVRTDGIIYNSGFNLIYYSQINKDGSLKTIISISSDNSFNDSLLKNNIYDAVSTTNSHLSLNNLKR